MSTKEYFDKLKETGIQHIKKLCKDFYLLGINHARLTILERVNKVEYDEKFEEAWDTN